MQDKDEEIMAIAQEECAEVIQAISKIFRFGYGAKHPDENRDNRERLEEELGDLMCMVDLMIDYKIIRQDKLWEAQGKKFEKLKKWSNIFDEKVIQ